MNTYRGVGNGRRGQGGKSRLRWLEERCKHPIHRSEPERHISGIVGASGPRDLDLGAETAPGAAALPRGRGRASRRILSPWAGAGAGSTGAHEA